ncbi:hypothetical protein BG011_001614 [Mortierella polycephala]|uniref:Uncharacterized protein n=1 Tax=Mortierella polycephala TaxID=41804 RepID=A0A9P6PK25_9FUNG|nr:hypothetical protein BG011_001614 [Mortierella polycephala]
MNSAPILTLDMDDFQEAYLKNTFGKSITLKDFVLRSNAVVSRKEYEEAWTSLALPLLRSHPTEDKRDAAARLAKTPLQQRIAIIDQAIAQRQQLVSMVPYVDKQSLSVLKLQTAEMETLVEKTNSTLSSAGASFSASSPSIFSDSTQTTEAKDALAENQYNVEEFDMMVERLDRTQFWRLRCSGRYVEDVLIQAARDTCTVQQYLDTFNKDNIEDLHKAADAHLPIAGPYDHKMHWIYRWIRIAIENWLGLYCQQPAPLKASQQESFWRNDVFGMINSLFRDVQDLVVVHGELTSKDAAQRRNGDRAFPTDGSLERKRMGYRCDGLVQVLGHQPSNIGVLEAGKVFDNTGSKVLLDTLNITRELHDMLRSRLQGLHVTSRNRELTVMGFVVSGPTLMTLFANSPGGYVVRVRPYHKELRIADDISHFRLNLRILKHLAVVKLVLLDTKDIIQEIPLGWDDEEEDITDEQNEADEQDAIEDEDATEEESTINHPPSTPPRRLHLLPLRTTPSRPKILRT